MEFVDFSFVQPAADAHEVAHKCHILLFVGYGTDPTHIEHILAGLQPGCLLADIVRRRVQFGGLWWIGMCGGAMCVGHAYRNWRALDLLGGASITYECGVSVDALGPSRCNAENLVFTSFAGIAISTRRSRGQKGSCFVVSKNGKTVKYEWCQDNQVKLRNALESICDRWHWHTFHDGRPGLWAWRLDHWMFLNGAVVDTDRRAVDDEF